MEIYNPEEVSLVYNKQNYKNRNNKTKLNLLTFDRNSK